MKEKKCTKCGIVKSELDFNMNGGGKRHSQCAKCRSIHKYLYRLRRSSCPIEYMGDRVDLYKECNKCNQTLYIYDFYIHRSSFKDTSSKAFGRSSSCISCTQKLHSKWREDNKEVIKEKKREYYYSGYNKVTSEKRKQIVKLKNWPMMIKENTLKKMGQKQCAKCNEIKLVSEYYKHNMGKDGLRSQCIDCVKERHRINADKISEYKRLKREGEPLTIRQSRNKVNREKYHTIYKHDNLWVLKQNLRKRTRDAFKLMGYAKGSNTHDLLGAPWKLVKNHIERQFVPGMTWDNYGEWHIDHIIPLATANTEAELIRLCHYRNLQPLWAKDNLSKGAKIIEPVQTYLPL